MRCFTACFRTNCIHKKIIKPCSSSDKINSISPKALQILLETHKNGEVSVAINATKEVQYEEVANPINLIEESKNKEEEEELNKSNRKNLHQTNENGEAFVAIDATKEEAQHGVSNPIILIEESKKKEEEEELNRRSSSSRRKDTFDLNVSIYDEVLLANQESANCSEINSQKQNGEEEANEVSNSSVSSYISYPPNHRYHCCRNSNDELEDIDLEDDANNNTNGLMIQEESSYESLFSLSIDSTKKGNTPTLEMDDKEEVNSPLKQSIKFSAKDRISQSSVRNPTQWITMPASQLKTKHQEKENIHLNLLQEQPGENQIAVDTSLSSWLVKSSHDDTPNSKNSAGSVGNSPSERIIRSKDRPILGSLTVAELKYEKPIIIIGTVGSYLRHRGQATVVYPDSGISSC